jgi:hypothetical protein
MSLIPRQKKEKKTDNLNYYNEYRQKNLEYIKALERSKYYIEKYNIQQDFINKFNEYSGDVFKIQNDFKTLIEKKPEFKQLILELLNN